MVLLCLFLGPDVTVSKAKAVHQVTQMTSRYQTQTLLGLDVLSETFPFLLSAEQLG